MVWYWRKLKNVLILRQVVEFCVDFWMFICSGHGRKWNPCTTHWILRLNFGTDSLCFQLTPHLCFTCLQDTQVAHERAVKDRKCCSRTSNECPPHKHPLVSSLRGQRSKVAAQCSRSCFGMQHFTQGHFSSVQSCDPELSLINHSTSGCFRKKTQMFTPKTCQF